MNSPKRTAPADRRRQPYPAIAPGRGHSPADVARILISHVRARPEYLPGASFENPQWLMTLELFVAGEESRAVSVSSLCIASGVPQTTALRHLRTLEDNGIVGRISHPRDRRITHMRLSDQARLQIARYLISVSSGELAEEKLPLHPPL